MLVAHVQLFVTPWTLAARLFCPWNSPSKNTGSGLPCPSPGCLPDLQIKPMSLRSPAFVVRFFINSVPWAYRKNGH